MADRVVTASIDANAKTVTLSPAIFRVDAGGNTVRWDVQGLPAGSTARVKFVGFVKAPEAPLRAAPEAPLFKAGNLLEAEGGVIRGVVDAGAGDGQYLYLVELVNREGGTTELKHVSSDGLPMPTAGGVKDGGPGRNP